MAGVIAWIVAIEGYTPSRGVASPLDFPAPVSKRAFEWADWLIQQPKTRLVLNISLRAQATPQERDRLTALAVQAGNTPTAQCANANALHEALRIVKDAPESTLLLVWMGHGVMLDGHRYLLHQDSIDVDDMRTWDIGSLLQHLRTGNAPDLQIGIFDACAQVGIAAPGNEHLGGSGDAARLQYFYFAALPSTQVSLNPDEPTASSIALQALRAVAWPPQPQDFDAELQSWANKLSPPLTAWEWTQGSGDRWSHRLAGVVQPADIERLARQYQVPAVVLRHLWDDHASLPVTLDALASALHQQRAEALIAGFEAQAVPGAELMRAAWQRVQRIEPWVPLLGALKLGLGQWIWLAELVTDDGGRIAPKFTELRELLLWALAMGGAPGPGNVRAESSLLRLMLLASREAGKAAAAAVQDLRSAFDADPVFAQLLPNVEPRVQLPHEPVVLLVELAAARRGAEPTISRHWVMHDDHFGPPDTTPLEGPFASQLNTLIDRVHDQTGRARPLRIELLAPAELLAARREWLAYRIDGKRPKPGDGIELDSFWPLYWRARDRLQRNPAWQAAAWPTHAEKVRRRANARAGLRCRFDDDLDGDLDDPPPPRNDSDVHGLVWSPGPRDTGDKRARFLQAIVQGSPYMVWPVDPPDDVRALKKQVRHWFGDQTLPQLPERYRDARREGTLPLLVLFIDEPDRNPYAARLQLPSASTS